jgi:hypothetical protein
MAAEMEIEQLREAIATVGCLYDYYLKLFFYCFLILFYK